MDYYLQDYSIHLFPNAPPEQKMRVVFHATIGVCMTPMSPMRPFYANPKGGNTFCDFMQIT